MLTPMHFDRGHMGLKFAIAAGERTPSLVNLLERNLACAAREDDVHPHFGIDQYLRPIDWAPRFCPNSYSTRKNRFPVRRRRTRCTWQRVKRVFHRGEEVVAQSQAEKASEELQGLGGVQVTPATAPIPEGRG
jgi:hypothetical protein